MTKLSLLLHLAVAVDGFGITIISFMVNSGPVSIILTCTIEIHYPPEEKELSWLLIMVANW